LTVPIGATALTVATAEVLLDQNELWIVEAKVVDDPLSLRANISSAGPRLRGGSSNSPYLRSELDVKSRPSLAVPTISRPSTHPYEPER
jgi:hypothetical protein